MSWIETLKLGGKFTGEYNDLKFSIEIEDKTVKVDCNEPELIKLAKDLFFDRLKEMQEDEQWVEFLKVYDIEVYLDKELIARMGKNAKPNFVSSFLGLKNLEVVSNSRITDLMSML